VKVLVADKLPSGTAGALRALGLDVEERTGLGPDALLAALADAHVLIVRSTQVSREVIAGAPHLQLVIRAGAGTNTIDTRAAAERGVYVSNTPGKNAIAVAELTMGLILALDRRIPDAIQDLRAGRWRKKEYGKARGLQGATLGILGLGQIGSEVAVRATAFGMRVLAWSRSLTAERAEGLGVHLAPDLLTLCAQSDVVSVHAAMTRETRHLVGARELAAMKDGTLVLNLARGGVVDEAALAAELARGRLRAAADVFEGEPEAGEAPFQTPLCAQAGFYGTPHVGASTDQAQGAIATEVVAILRRWLMTGEVLHCKNLSERSRAAGQLFVRHRDEVGVLASVLDVLRRASLNVQEMSNAIFAGGEAAAAKITLEQEPSPEVLRALAAASPHLLGVEWVRAA
jgi:D-3-phosphoglycerate dehydrogenase